MSQPNILLITDDQHRWDFFDNQTVEVLQTPNLDRLRREGATLTNGYSNCPICMPTRMTWVYGLYASQVGAGLLRNALDWPTAMPSMPQALQKVGYQTALIGKLHSLQGLFDRDVCAYEEETRSRGFDDVIEVCGKSLSYWYQCNWTRHLAGKGLLDVYRKDASSRFESRGGVEHSGPGILEAEDSMDGFIGTRARNWLRQYESDKPFFLHASFCGPHFPIDPPAEYHRRYQPEEMPAPHGVDAPEAIRQWQVRTAAYCGMIEQIDDEVGRLLDLLATKGLEKNTAVIFGTDHGDMMGHHNRAHKGTFYDTSARTPYLVRWPEHINGGEVLTAPVEAADLPCTILEIAGLGTEGTGHLPHTPGRSWLGYASNCREAPREWAYSEHQSWRMVRSPDWKYVFSTGGEEHLYDMLTDPWEMTNLAEETGHQQQLATMRKQMIESLQSCVAPWEPEEGN